MLRNASVNFGLCDRTWHISELADGGEVRLELHELHHRDEHALQHERLARREQRDEAALQPQRVGGRDGVELGRLERMRWRGANARPSARTHSPREEAAPARPLTTCTPRRTTSGCADGTSGC